MTELPHQSFQEALTQGRGEGVLVAVLDSGIASNHPHFAKAKFEEQISPNLKLEEGCQREKLSDNLGHGTAVAGIIHQLAPDARLLSIRVLKGGAMKDRHKLIQLGIKEALRRGASIINCSFGSPAASFTFPLYKQWTDQAFDQGVPVVTASSNTDPLAPEWPSAFRTTLATTDAQLISNDLRFRGGSIPFAAAGIEIEVPTPDGGTAVRTGSSFAAAHLTGQLARLLSVHPELSPSYLREILTYHASKSERSPRLRKSQSGSR